MTIVWNDVAPGELTSPRELEPGVLLFGDPIPDWVRLPPNLGATRHRVVAQTTHECVCKTEHPARHLKLDNGIVVTECFERGEFLWWRLRE